MYIKRCGNVLVKEGEGKHLKNVLNLYSMSQRGKVILLISSVTGGDGSFLEQSNFD